MLGEDLNMSQIFQSALQTELRRVGQRRQHIAEIESRVDLKALRERLHRERSELYQQGYELGLRYANEAGYIDLRYIKDNFWSKPVAIDEAPDPIKSELYKIANKHAGRKLRPDLLGRMVPPDHVLHGDLADGYTAALRQVWELVMADEGS
jgi:hypothetical protein